MKNTIIFLKGLCLMCAILRTFFYSNSEFFFKLLVFHTLTSVVDKLLHNINVIKINYANTVTNTVKHTLSIIISLLFSLNGKTKTITKTNKNEKKFFLVKYVYYSPTIEL